MKLLGKTPNSEIIAEGLTYQENRSRNNKRLLELLLSEQRNFCAYTEKYVQGLDSTEVEHFNSAIKYWDDYYNYYAVLRKANEYKIKKDNTYRNAGFLDNLFFQNNDDFSRRVHYVDGVYEETDAMDIEAKNFIDFLGFNEHPLYQDRKNHVERLKESFENAGWDSQRCLDYFRTYPNELSFITALEHELGLNLVEFYR